MTYRMGFFLLALGVAGACAGTRDLTPSAPLFDEASARNGALAVQKNCQFFTGSAGDFCTISESNLAAIPVGSVITYRSAAVNGIVDTDITLDPPGPGANTAYGHCVVNLATGLGTCSLTGGTGRFRGFNASVDVTPLGWPNFAWNGSYYYDN